MKKINIISGFIITFIFMMLVDEILLQDFEEMLVKVIIYLVSLYSSTYYFVVRHLIKE